MNRVESFKLGQRANADLAELEERTVGELRDLHESPRVESGQALPILLLCREARSATLHHFHPGMSLSPTPDEHQRFP